MDTARVASQSIASADSDAVALARTQVQSSLRAPASHEDVDVAPTSLEDRGFDDRYDLRVVLGEGGMGEVRLARDRRVGRDVAVKVIRAGHGSRSDARARFEREARVQGQLEHPTVVPVYDLGLRPDGAAFFTMKRLRGRTLEQILDGLRAGDPEITAQTTRRRLLAALSTVCLGVAFAHARGVVHRDLKPANVMLGSYGEVHLLDWGLARLEGGDDAEPLSSRPTNPPGAEPLVDAPLADHHKTAFGAIMGTPGYMAPEQARGDVAVDARADVYALGAILFELLTLEPLHARTTFEGLITSTLAGCDARASVRLASQGGTAQADVPPELEAICVRATALDPADRFQTAREMADAIDRFLDGDRDLAMRKEMADAGAAAASASAALAAEGGDGAHEARARALREVNAALAIDPTHRAALATLVRLLTETPRHMTPDARVEYERSGAAADAVARRSTVSAYLGFFALMPLVLALGVRSWPAYLLLLGSGAASTGVAAYAYFKKKPIQYGLVAYLFSCVCIATTSLIAGPFVLAPALAAVNTISFASYAPRPWRLFVVALGIVTVLAPVALWAAGVVPAPYGVGASGGIVVYPLLSDLPPVTTAIVLTAAFVAIIAFPATLLGRIRDALTAAEERVFLHGYHLRQIIPAEARGAALVPPPSEPLPMCKLQGSAVE